MAIRPIDPDTARICRRFAGTSKSFVNLITAVEQAEGNIIKAVQCTYKDVKDRDTALDITCRSAVHAMADYLAGSSGFVRFWQQRWAPSGAANDPTNLNAHWEGNVSRLWKA